MTSYFPQNILIPDCTLQQFEKAANANHRFLRMNLIEGQLEIIVPETSITSPDVAVVLSARWNALSDAERCQAFPPVAPNFIVELRSYSRIFIVKYYDGLMMV
ncbi:19444_t:CDS:2 [Funneliformis geosporum]|uniref:9509_t:CDS:1 n=1 Tax=Funneliformis geosporum TaxID=1117311 RepID=A0A9W4SJL4_9GLOM|nr:19444_t:CDS:2 [Funneliformis geosporum]CAI2172310.1 9509_t:CDS:2 [Funneliformis geosporum]